MRNINFAFLVYERTGINNHINLLSFSVHFIIHTHTFERYVDERDREETRAKRQKFRDIVNRSLLTYYGQNEIASKKSMCLLSCRIVWYVYFACCDPKIPSKFGFLFERCQTKKYFLIFLHPILFFVPILFRTI